MEQCNLEQSPEDELRESEFPQRRRMTAWGLLGETFRYILNNVWRLVFLSIQVGAVGVVFFLIPLALGYLLVALLKIPKPFPANMVVVLLVMAVIGPIGAWWNCTIFMSARRGILGKHDYNVALGLLLARFGQVFVLGIILCLLMRIPAIVYYFASGRAIYSVAYASLSFADRIVFRLGWPLALPLTFSTMEAMVRGKSISQSLVSSVRLFRRSIGLVLSWAVLWEVGEFILSFQRAASAEAQFRWLEMGFRLLVAFVFFTISSTYFVLIYNEAVQRQEGAGEHFPALVKAEKRGQAAEGEKYSLRYNE